MGIAQRPRAAAVASIANERIVAFVQGIEAFAIYLAASLFFFGRGLIGHWSDRFIGREADPSQMMWLLKWWPYAIQHHLNPFLTDYVWAPVRFNLAVMTSIPLPAIVAMPLTESLGVVATFNLLMLLAAPLAATCAFIFCRRATGAFLPSVLGGAVFGFSPYMLGQTLNHFCLLLVFPVPIAAYLILRQLEESISARRFVFLMTVTLVAQFLMHPEVFTTATVTGALVLLIALCCYRNDVRSQLWHLSGLIAVSYVLSGLILSPYLYYFFSFGTLHQLFWPPEKFSTDAGNFLIPTSVNLLGGIPGLPVLTGSFAGTLAERNGFIAFPLMLIFVTWARNFWSQPLAKTLTLSLVTIAIVTVGPYLQINRIPIAPMPWLIFTHLPLVQHTLPSRFMVYPPLILGLVLALWLSDQRISRRLKAIACMAVMLIILPNPEASFWVSRVETPQFFVDGSASRYLNRSDIVLTLPWGITGQSMLWQAQCDMCFRNVSGWTGTERFDVRRWPIANYFLGSPDLPEPELQLKTFLAKTGTTAIAIDEHNPRAPQWESLVEAVGLKPEAISGISLYHIPNNRFDEDSYRTSLEMEKRALDLRLSTVFVATDSYLSAGYPTEDISPNRLVELGFLPASWRRQPNTLYDLIILPQGQVEVVIGELGSPTALKEVVDRFGTNALQIYLPYPRIFAGKASLRLGELLQNWLLPPASMPIDGESMEFVGFAFNRAQLREATRNLPSAISAEGETQSGWR